MYLVWWLAVLALGGSSRADEPAQYFLRTIAVIVFGVSVLRLRAVKYAHPKPIAMTIKAAAAIVATQMIPLPPYIWSRIPGREELTDSALQVGMAGLWRPATIDVLATANALMSLVIPAAMYSMISLTRPSDVRRVLYVVLFSGLVSGALYALGEAGNWVSIVYRLHSASEFTGLFVNRNHHALFTAAQIPIIFYIIHIFASDNKSTRTFRGLALLYFAILFSLLLTIGSRFGLIMGLVGAAGGLANWSFSRRKRLPEREAAGKLVFSIGLLLAIGLFGFLAQLPQSESVARIQRHQPAADLRWSLGPTSVLLAGKYFPVGAGAGTFPAAYRIVEPDDNLGPMYVNHAHNDWLEWTIESGLLGLFLTVSVFGWFCRVSVIAWRQTPKNDELGVAARVASIIGLQIWLSCLVDYPMRTPIFQCLAVIVASILWRNSMRLAGPHTSMAR